MIFEHTNIDEPSEEEGPVEVYWKVIPGRERNSIPQIFPDILLTFTHACRAAT
jgi:hypothetical protein